MRKVVLVVGAIISVVPMVALAQTTTTDCTIYGDQAHCESTSQQSPQQALEADQARRDAEMRQAQQDATEANHRLDVDTVARAISQGNCWLAKFTARNSGDLDLMAKVAALCH
jgi:hypothetical protein